MTLQALMSSAQMTYLLVASSQAEDHSQSFNWPLRIWPKILPTEDKLVWYERESLWMQRILAKKNKILRVPEPVDITSLRRGRCGRPPATPTNTAMTSDNSSSGRSVSPIGDTRYLYQDSLHPRGSRSRYLQESPIWAFVHACQESRFHKTLFCELFPASNTLLSWINSAWSKAARGMERQTPLLVSCTPQVANSFPNEAIHRLSALLTLESMELTCENQSQVFITASNAYYISVGYCVS